MKDLNRPASSLANLNRHLPHKLYRSPAGYYYFPDFVSDERATLDLNESVYVYSHTQLTIAQWITEHDKRFNPLEGTHVQV